MGLHNVKIQLKPGSGSVTIDGIDIKNITSITVYGGAGDIPEVEIRLLANEVEILAEAEVNFE